MIKFMQRIYRRWFIQYRWANVLRGWFLRSYRRYLSFVHYLRFEFSPSYSLLDSVSQMADAANDEYANSRTLLLDDVTLVGHTQFIMKNNMVAYDASHPDWPLREIYTSFCFQEENFGLMRFEPHRGHCRFRIDLKKTQTRLNGAWLSVMSASSENWMHWLSESVPRLAGVLDTMKNSKFKLLVDQQLAKNMRDVLDIFAAGIPRFEVAPNQALKVSQLIVTARPTGISAFWLRTPQPDVSSSRPGQAAIHFRANGTFHFDVSGLRQVREVMLKHFDCQPRKARKLFILRRSYFRHIANQERIEMMLLAHGFESISPGELSVEEQVRAFSEATVVVAQAGAALANIMFMPEGGKVICLSVRNPEYVNYDYFRDYAKIFGVSLEYVLGEIDDPSKYNAAHIGRVTHPTNAEFTCPENELLEMLDGLNEQSERAYV